MKEKGERVCILREGRKGGERLSIKTESVCSDYTNIVLRDFFFLVANHIARGQNWLILLHKSNHSISEGSNNWFLMSHKGMIKSFWYQNSIFSDLYMHKANKKSELGFVIPLDHCALVLFESSFIFILPDLPVLSLSWIVLNRLLIPWLPVLEPGVCLAFCHAIRAVLSSRYHCHHCQPRKKTAHHNNEKIAINL